MQRASKTPKRSEIHGSLDYLLTDETLRDSLAGLPGVEEMRVGFAKFAGSTFQDMPRPDVTYYPVLAFFRLPVGQRFIPFDQYRLEAGMTALIYPVYRARKGSIIERLFESVMPPCRDWFERLQRPSRVLKTESFYIYYDQTFDEVVHRPNHALQRTRHDASVCNPRVPSAGSLSLGR
jgi:hypothetical protein